ncbi:MAG: cytochrome c4 [Leptothrix sp. (in: Bacteria)]|nr:cytochrome c4 [Leptothrix sp. (in: b-proteobacteria)]
MLNSWTRPFIVATSALAFVVVAMAAEAPHDSAEAIADRMGDGNPVAGKVKSEAGRCQSCHGVAGHGAAPEYPKLAGQYADYILNQVRNFQSGQRKHPVIQASSPAFSEGDLADIAAYFASQQSMTGGGQPAAESPVSSLYARGDLKRDVLACASCHGEHGKSTFNGADSYPVIGGQQAAYVKAQLLSMRAGARKSGLGGVMNIVAKSLKDEEIEALSNYIAGM